MSRADDVLAYGLAEVGSPYVWGAEGPDTFDCSGLMQYIFAKVGVQLPRTAREQQRALPLVGSPRPGDLVFWGSPATHVGLYVGDGRFLAAPRAGERVRVSKLYGSPEFRRPAGLGGLGAVVPVGLPGAGAVGDMFSKSADWLRVGLVAAGGVALVVVGAWQASRGDRS